LFWTVADGFLLFLPSVGVGDLGDPRAVHATASRSGQRRVNWASFSVLTTTVMSFFIEKRRYTWNWLPSRATSLERTIAGRKISA